MEDDDFEEEFSTIDVDSKKALSEELSEFDPIFIVDYCVFSNIDDLFEFIKKYNVDILETNTEELDAEYNIHYLYEDEEFQDYQLSNFGKMTEFEMLLDDMGIRLSEKVKKKNQHLYDSEELGLL